MFEAYYGLTAPPFQLSPDHRLCFRHRSYDKAKAYLDYAVDRAEGFVMIIGGPGVGKTTLINDLIDGLANAPVTVAKLQSSQLGTDDLLRLVSFSFDLEPQASDKSTLLRDIERFLAEQRKAGRTAVLVVDEAQDLPTSALEELRVLSNLQLNSEPLLQIFLLGQDGLVELVQRPGMEQLRRRLIATYELTPLDALETEAYIRTRLEKVGWNGDPQFGEEVFRLIHVLSDGVPHRINMLCSRLLLRSCTEQKHDVDQDDFWQVIDDLQKEKLMPTGEQTPVGTVPHPVNASPTTARGKPKLVAVPKTAQREPDSKDLTEDPHPPASTLSTTAENRLPISTEAKVVRPAQFADRNARNSSASFPANLPHPNAVGATSQAEIPLLVRRASQRPTVDASPDNSRAPNASDRKSWNWKGVAAIAAGGCAVSAAMLVLELWTRQVAPPPAEPSKTTAQTASVQPGEKTGQDDLLAGDQTSLAKLSPSARRATPRLETPVQPTQPATAEDGDAAQTLEGLRNATQTPLSDPPLSNPVGASLDENQLSDVASGQISEDEGMSDTGTLAENSRELRAKAGGADSGDVADSRDPGVRIDVALSMADSYEQSARLLQAEGALEASLISIERGLRLMPQHRGLLAVRASVEEALADRDGAAPAARTTADGITKIPDHDARKIASTRSAQPSTDERPLGAEPTAISTRPVANQEVRLNQQRTTELLALAEQQFTAYQLSSPPGNNALETYRGILKLAPTDEQALAGIEKIKNKYRTWGQAATVKKQWAQAEGYLKKGLAIDPKDSGLNAAQRKLQETRKAQQLAAAPKAQIAAIQSSQASQGTLSSIQTPGSAQSAKVVRIQGVKHQVINSRAPATVAIHAAITGGVERAEVFVASDQGFIPYIMYDGGPPGDSTPDERRYSRQIKLPNLTRPTRYYVAVYTQDGTVIYSPRNAEIEAYLIEAQLPQNSRPSVIISEFMAVNEQTVTDPQGDYDDWIELQNTSSTEIDLSGMYLSDDPERPKKWRFPEGTRLAGHRYLIVWADQEIGYTHVSASAVELHANFRLADRGAQILLMDSDQNGNVLLDQISFDRQRPDMSMARDIKAAEFAAMRLGTPGQAN